MQGSSSDIGGGCNSLGLCLISDTPQLMLWKTVRQALLDPLVWSTSTTTTGTGTTTATGTGTTTGATTSKPLPVALIEEFVFSVPWQPPLSSSHSTAAKVADDLRGLFRSLLLEQQSIQQQQASVASIALTSSSVITSALVALADNAVPSSNAVPALPRAHQTTSLALHKFVVCLLLLLPTLDPLRVFADYFDQLLWPVLAHHIHSNSEQYQTTQNLLITLLKTDLSSSLDVGGVHANGLRSAARTVLGKCVAESLFWQPDAIPTNAQAGVVGLASTPQSEHSRILAELDASAGPFRSRVLTGISHVLFSFGMSRPLVLYDLLNELAIDPNTRLRSFMLLKTFLIWEDAPTYYLVDSVLFESVVHSAMIDSDVATFTAAITILTILLPIVSSKAVARFGRLMGVFLRALHWELTYPQVLRISSEIPEFHAAHDDLFLQFSVCATRRCINNYFTVIYGMFPANVVAQLQKLLTSGISNLSPILHQSDKLLLNFKPVQDEFAHIRAKAYELIEVEEEDLFQQRVKDLVRDHRVHPHIITTSVTKELSNPWFSAKEASEIMVECMSLRIDASVCMESPSESLSVDAEANISENNLRSCLNQVAIIDKALHGHISSLQITALDRREVTSPTAGKILTTVPTSPMLLLRMYYYVLMNESFFKECMRQYHMMHIRRLHKNAFEYGLRDASIQNLHMRFKQQTNELVQQRQLVERLRQEGANLRERHRGHDEEGVKRAKEMRNEMRQLQATVRVLTSNLESTTQENMNLKTQLSESERLLSQSESKLMLAMRDTALLREYEAVVPGLQAKIIENGSSGNHSSNRMTSSSITSDNMDDEIADLGAQIKTLQMLLKATERDCASYELGRQEATFLRGQLELKNHELDRLDGLAKAQSSELLLLRQQFQDKIDAQELKYTSLRKLHLLLQSRIVSMTPKTNSMSTAIH
ncbi:hypothetical protein BASA60_000237 [Batrachochytrium salamandrivorans]|nr:hypothetical protein BASA60_000237 [Batrachochytrium salamandrivorans]